MEWERDARAATGGSVPWVSTAGAEAGMGMVGDKDARGLRHLKGAQGMRSDVEGVGC